MKNALITGASGGIGLSIAKQLAGEGYSLTLVARREDELKKIVGALPGTGHDFLIADLSNPGDVTKIGDHLGAHHYSVLINNAGTGIYGNFGEIGLEDHLKMMRLNCEALLVLSYAYLQHAVTSDALINIGSVLGSTSYAAAAAYAGTKGFVIRFSESLWDEYRKKGIYVCVFSPGVTSSNFHNNAGGDEAGFPKAIMQTSQQVAAELSLALRRRSKPHVVSGAMNRGMLFFYRLLTRKAIVKMMGSFSPVKK